MKKNIDYEKNCQIGSENRKVRGKMIAIILTVLGFIFALKEKEL